MVPSADDREQSFLDAADTGNTVKGGATAVDDVMSPEMRGMHRIAFGQRLIASLIDADAWTIRSEAADIELAKNANFVVQGAQASLRLQNLRVAARKGALGRRKTIASDAVEWERCSDDRNAENAENADADAKSVNAEGRIADAMVGIGNAREWDAELSRTVSETCIGDADGNTKGASFARG